MSEVIIEVSLKDVIQRLEHPDEFPDHVDFLNRIWIDEFIKILREELEKVDEQSTTANQ